MAIVTKVKKEILSGMEEANIYTMMAVTILVIGSKARCKVKASWLMQMAILYIRANGKTITTRGRVD
jgi:uncharacterized lipoprotein NlpE involved in copper resistance